MLHHDRKSKAVVPRVLELSHRIKHHMGVSPKSISLDQVSLGLFHEIQLNDLVTGFSSYSPIETIFDFFECFFFITFIVN